MLMKRQSITLILNTHFLYLYFFFICFFTDQMGQEKVPPKDNFERFFFIISYKVLILTVYSNSFFSNGGTFLIPHKTRENLNSYYDFITD